MTIQAIFGKISDLVDIKGLAGYNLNPIRSGYTSPDSTESLYFCLHSSRRFSILILLFLLSYNIVSGNREVVNQK